MLKKYVTQQKTTTELRAPDFGQEHTYRSWRGLTCKRYPIPVSNRGQLFNITT